MDELRIIDASIRKVNFKKLNEYAKEPFRGSKHAAGWDLYAATANDTTIPAHSTVMIGTGLAMDCPIDTFIGIFARSGLAVKQGLRPANCVGVVDADYRGEIMVAVHNDTDVDQVVKAGDRIAQMILLPFYSIYFKKMDDLEETERGEGGFGSTGDK